MNKKFLKILTGFSAMAVAGVLSFVPATRAEAAISTYGYRFTIHDDEQNYSGMSEDFTSTIDLDILDMYGEGYHDNLTANIYFWGTELNEDFTMTFTTPFPVSSIDFLEYYEQNDENYIAGQDGIIYSVSADGYTITIIGNSANRGGIDAWYRIALGSPKTPDDLFSEEITTTVEDIVKAAQGINHDGSENPQKVVFYNCNGAVNYRIIQALAKTQGVTLLYTFEYQGYVFTSAITSEMAAQIFIEGEDWYGPCYIAKHCPTVLVDVVK